MKVLSMAWTIYDNRLQEFCKDCTGGGLVIKNICEYIGKVQESYLFIGSTKLPKLELGNIHIIDTSFCEDIDDEKLTPKQKNLKMMTQAFEVVLDEIKPDIVNFHGTGKLMKHCLCICVDRHIPYVYTEHLFIGQDKCFDGCEENVRWEEQIYNIPDIQIIAVSAGMKKKILQNFPHIPSENICVIRNGTDFYAVQEENDIRQRYSLEGKKVLICVGSINSRKNQCQVIKAFKLLPSFVQDNIKILFCGIDSMNGKLENEIEKAGLQDRLIYVGAVSSDKMKNYYSVADGLIMPSYAEGLSIAALEAIAYGLPVILFSDSECADDLNDDEIACFAKGRTDSCLAEAIVKWGTKKWNKEYIMEYSKQFSMERVAQEYIEHYQYIINKQEENKRD